MQLAGSGHLFLAPADPATEEIESRENFIQFILARPMQIVLHAIAAARATSPNGREINNAAGMKMKARISNAAVAV
jgi:hypothetical protein